MRIPAREVLFTGQDRCPEFDLCKEPLPQELNILLCLLDGAERRRQGHGHRASFRRGGEGTACAPATPFRTRPTTRARARSAVHS